MISHETKNMCPIPDSNWQPQDYRFYPGPMESVELKVELGINSRLNYQTTVRTETKRLTFHEIFGQSQERQA